MGLCGRHGTNSFPSWGLPGGGAEAVDDGVYRRPIFFDRALGTVEVHRWIATFFEPQSVVSNRGRDAVRVYVRGDVSGKPRARWADGRIEFEYGPRGREHIF